MVGTQCRRTKRHGEDSQERSNAERHAKVLNDPPLARGRQLNRQLSVLRLLECARRGLTIAELYEALDEGCSLRTVYRDIEQLPARGRGLGGELRRQGPRARAQAPGARGSSVARERVRGVWKCEKPRTGAGRLTSDVDGWGDDEERTWNRC